MNKKQQNFLEAYGPVKDNIWRFCLYLTFNRNAAEELLAHTIASAFEGFDRLKNKQAFLSYLFTIASRTWGEEKRKRMRFESSEEVIDSMTQPATQEQQLEYRLLMERMVALSENEREVVILIIIEGYSRKECAEMLSMKEETVKSNLYRAKKKLREQMEINNGK